MTWFKGACRRFRGLCEDREDRELSIEEVDFLEQHRSACRPCYRYDVATSHSLNMLRSVSMDPDPNPTYDERVIRMVRLDRGRDRLTYWFPMVIGAGIASFAVFALMQLVTTTHDLKSADPRGLPAVNEVHGPRKLLPPAESRPLLPR